MRDLRKYANQTSFRLALGFILILLLIGDGLIYYLYGKSAALTGLICIIGGLFPIVLIWLLLVLVEWVAKRADE